MCGTVGLAVHQSMKFDLTTGKKHLFLDSIRRRGPDMQRQYEDGNIWLRHVRLSILDFNDVASQSMITPD